MRPVPKSTTNSSAKRSSKPAVRGGDDGPETQKGYNAAYKRAQAGMKKKKK